MKKFRNTKDIPLDPRKWYEEFEKSSKPFTSNISDMKIMELKEEAKKCLDSESTAYHLKQSKSKNSEYSWLKAASIKGTISDKVAANVVLIQNSPKHNLNNLKSIVSMAKVAKHNQCSILITTLKELFLTDLLHPDFKLLKFEEQNLDKINSLNLGNENTKSVSRSKLLGYWFFEDQLKETYEHFVSSLSEIACDSVDTNREKSVSVMCDLLIGNPEQEQKLLDFIVNKVGDPSSKVASKAVFSLNKILHEHPNMKIIVLKEIEKLLFRSNIAQRAQYYAICLLTQFVLSKEDVKVAALLIEVYFSFFKACFKKGEPDSRMMAAILAGVNRAYPFVDSDTASLKDHIDAVYKVVHHGSFNASLNALSLLFQVVGKDSSQCDRFFSAFYRKLLDPEIGNANRRKVFLNLLYRSLRSDQSVLRLHAFIKRILQIIIYFSPNMTCATLYVISQILRSRKYTSKILCNLEAVIKEEVETVNLSSKNSEANDFVKNKKKIKNLENNDCNIILSNVTDTPIINQKISSENDIKEEDQFKTKSYDPFARNPLYCGAKCSLYTELSALTLHYHPSVALFASTVLEGKSIEYTGDPLEDLTLIRFLDRYVFKNPKKLENKKVVQKNNPLALRVGYTPKGIRSLPVESQAYLNEREDRIPVDELFLYQYLKKKQVNKESEDYFDDNESVNSEDFNDMLDQLSKEKDFNDLDIAGELGTSIPVNNIRKGKKSKDGNLEDNSDEDEQSYASESDDDEVNNKNADLQDLDDIDLDISDDVSDLEFNDSDDDGSDIEALKNPLKRKQKHQKATKAKKLKKGIENVFASSEEFSELLESQGKAKFKFSGSSAFNDADGAVAKQLDWETQRNNKLQNYRTKKRKEKFNKSSKKKHQKHEFRNKTATKRKKK